MLKSRYFINYLLFTFLLNRRVFGDLNFPKDFVFGVASSAFQIEGAWNENGKSESYWDHKMHVFPGTIKDGSNADIACDSYHKIDEDVRIIRELGVQSYRFSLSWTRILPDGFGTRVNEDGIRYYNKLIDSLIQHNIIPLVTINHKDHPQSLHELGGWTNLFMINAYIDYARVVFENFGDRVKHWTTFNEPQKICNDTRAGTVVSDGFGPYLCAYTLLKAHAKAYHMYKNDFADQKGEIGIVLDSAWHIPKTNSPQDMQAVKRASAFGFGLFANPIFSKEGDFPTIVKERIAYMSARQNLTWSRLPHFTEEEIVAIRGTADYFALNHYSSSLVSEPIEESLEISYEADINVDIDYDPSWPSSESTWLKTYPPGIYHLLEYIKHKYGNPKLYITENGFSEYDLQDNGRINYHKGYLESVSNAIANGCNVVGYYAWSLMDNFQFGAGYSECFGLYRVNFTDPNRTRTPRESAFWYRDFITFQKNKHFHNIFV